MSLNSTILFYITFCVGLINLSLIIAGNISDKIIYWPPPRKNSWQFYCIWSLFSIFAILYLALLYLKIDNLNANPTLILLGSTLAVTGLFFANYITYKLGVENASGLKKGLKTKGWYSVSRNPVYTATFVALIGTIILFPIYEITILSLFWIFSYIVAVLSEEKWLEKEYGEEYLIYKKEVPRFFWRRLF